MSAYLDRAPRTYAEALGDAIHNAEARHDYLRAAALQIELLKEVIK